MIMAAAAGLTPLQVDELTLGEVIIVIEGYHERERLSLVSRINAVLRALSQKGDPFKGLRSGLEQAASRTLSLKEATRRWLWTPKPDDSQ